MIQRGSNAKTRQRRPRPGLGGRLLLPGFPTARQRRNISHLPKLKRDPRQGGGARTPHIAPPAAPTDALIRLSFSVRYVNGPCCESKQNQSVVVLLSKEQRVEGPRSRSSMVWQ